MNKILKLLAAATLIALTTAACQKEKLFDSQTAGEETVTFTVKTDAAATKATADNDGLGAGLTRCLVAVYMKTGNSAEPYKLYDTPSTTKQDNEHYSFTVNLIRKQTYQIVVWADKGKYTVSDDLSSVTRIADDKACNSDAYDAFYASVPFTQGTTASTAITAKRPFAQLNLITKDLRKGFEPKDIELTYTADTKFNPFDGTTSDSQTVTYKSTTPHYGASLANPVPAENTVAMNYLFANDEQSVLSEVKLKATFTNAVELAVANVPVRRNYRTNIKGNLFTEQTNFNITVDPLWGGSDIDQYIAATVAGNPYTSIEEAFQHATNGETIILANNVETAGITVPAGATTILNLAGKTITAAPQTRSANGETALTVAGELTITGEGTVNGGAGGNNKAVYVVAGGKAIINGGYFTVGADANGLGNSCIECNGGVVVINGGYFRTEAAYNNFYYVLNQINSNPGTIQVKGGQFENYNPTRGDDNLLGTFVASGYTSKKISDNPVVYEVGPAPAVTVATAAELKTMLTNLTAAGAGDNVVEISADIQLAEGETWESIDVKGYQGAGVITVKGNGHTISGLNAPLFAGGFAGESGIAIHALTLDKVKINDGTERQGLGAFVGCVDSMYKIVLLNCKLTNSEIVSTAGARVGGLIGWTAGYNKPNDGPVTLTVTVKGCVVEKCSITAAGSVGGIIGHAGNNPATLHNIQNCEVKNCTLHSTDDGDWRVGVVVGTANVGKVTISGITEAGNTISQVDKTAPKHSNLYGRFVPDGDNGTLTIDGVSITQ